jgi:hypothetical protein
MTNDCRRGESLPSIHVPLCYSVAGTARIPSQTDHCQRQQGSGDSGNAPVKSHLGYCVENRQNATDIETG